MSAHGVEDIYAMTPLQQGLLFHSLLAPESGLYLDQFVLELRGDLDLAALGRAWREVASRHAILRTSFHWENLGKPLQVVHREMDLNVESHDWRAHPPAAREELLAEFLKADRGRGFDLTAPPLMRLAVARVGGDAHLFIWSFPHIILDGWSAAIVRTEVFALYDALTGGAEPTLEPVTPFGAYISWLRRQDLSAAEAFWRRKLKGFTPPAPLAFGPAQTSSPEADRGVQEVRLAPELTGALRALARRHRLTLSTLLLGAWATLLSRHAGTRDIVIGVTVSGRPESLAGVEGIVGNFINTLPVRVRVSSDPLVSWLRQLQAEQLELRQYEHTPLVEVQKWSGVAAGQPLFETIFVFENTAPARPADEEANGPVRVGAARHLFKTNYPLTVQVSPGERLSIRVEYDGRRFGADVIARVLGRLEALLVDFVAAPDRPSPAPSFAADGEARRLPREWNETRVDYPDSSSIQELFEVQTRRAPEATALVFEGGRLSYGGLNARANRLAHHLRRLGVGPEVPVGVCLERSAEMVVAVLGILKAGGVCVPLDPSYPKERLAFMARDARVRVVLTEARLAELWLTGQEEPPAILALDEAAEALALESADDPPHGVAADGLAYVIYTSGSTGTPKGVGVCHRGVVRLLFGQNYVRLTGAETLLQSSPLSFDASFFELWGALLHGGRCVLLPAVSPAAHELARVVREHGVSVLWLTASLFNAVVDEDPEALAGVRQLLVGGEALSVSHVGRALERLPATRIVNGYGPTENTTFTCCHEVSRPLDPALGSIPIGRPVANTRVYVLDAGLTPAPVGVVGELYAAGAGLARGYLRRPGLTAERFLPDPFSSEPGARMYRTGDLARRLPGGELEFVGRVDHQVKVRGFRVELGEIEAALARHESVGEAVVVAREGAAGGRQLVAYVVPADSRALQAAELRGFLRERLPEYMLPAAFVALGRLPLTLNGKVDRRALAARELDARGGGAASHTTPRTVVEELMADLWSSVLGVESVGVNEDFLELGGHSLLAIQLVSRVRETFNVELPVRSLFETRTVAGLAAETERRLGAGVSSSIPPLAPAARGAAVPLSFAQQRLWILDQLEPGLPVYNVPVAVSINGRLDVVALEKSLNEVVRRHEALRTSFEVRGGLPVQTIAAALTLTLPLTDLSARPEEARRLAAEEARRRFDLAAGPLVRARLFRLGEEEHALVLTLHHIVSDGWSLEILVREVAALYEGFVAGVAPALPELPVQYADYAVWQRDWLRGEVLERQLAYWRARLAGAPSGLELPSSRRRPAVQTFEGGSLPFELPPRMSEALKTLSRGERATLFMTLLAAFKTLLHRYTGEEDLLVGTVAANRGHAGIEHLVGFFVNTLVLRTDFSNDPNFRDALARVREVVLGAYAHQDVPFERLVEELQPERNLSLSPLFQVLFAFRHGQERPPEVPGLSINFMQIETGTAKFDLALLMSEDERGLTGTLEYNRTLFEEAAMARMLEHFRALLEGVTADPDRPVSRHTLLTAGERRLLSEWNDTRAAYERDLCLHELFEAQAARTPDAEAVVCGEERLTYRALDERANRLARRLRRLGVREEVVVGVFMDRVPEMLVGLLAVLKAGGAYLPLDPAYPKERMAFMLADVRARALLTQEHLAGRLPAHDGTVVLLKGDGAEYAGESAMRPARRAMPRNLAYLIYTSGSTGRPKGVAIEHRNVVAFLAWARAAFSDEEMSDVLATTSVCFDVSVFELFAPLSRGGRVRLAGNALDLLAPDANVRRSKIINVVPSVMSEVLRAADLPPSVRTVNLPGEAVPESLVEQLYRQSNVERVLNLYGPSEDTTFSTVALCEPGAGRGPTIGRPIANKRVYLLDKHLNPVPVGLVGEAYTAGAGLARGYYDRPALTAERFVPDPFSAEPGARMYRTGDLARHLPGGELDYLGRTDNQVKVRGFRVELGEVEAALRRHEAVGEAVAAVARAEASEDKRIVAYVVARPEARPRADELLSFLRGQLPEYMLPSAIALIDALPLQPNGKINRRALPPVGGLPGASAGEADAAPRDELELTIADVWREVLGVAEVGVRDNFFSDLGGHSLLAVQAVLKLRERLGTHVSFVDMFQFPTVSSLAGHWRGGDDGLPSRAEVDGQARARQESARRRRRFKQSRLQLSAE